MVVDGLDPFDGRPWQEKTTAVQLAFVRKHFLESAKLKQMAGENLLYLTDEITQVVNEICEAHVVKDPGNIDRDAFLALRTKLKKIMRSELGS